LKEWQESALSACDADGERKLVFVNILESRGLGQGCLKGSRRLRSRRRRTAASSSTASTTSTSTGYRVRSISACSGGEVRLAQVIGFEG
jgi:hypothetical protein